MSVLPAPAGMSPTEEQRMKCKRRAPRACGDEPFLPLRGGSAFQCSPRLRG